jgi:hypothetical protein
MSQAIFGTSFFSFGGTSAVGDGWSVAHEFWIFWATSIPLTAVVLVVWYAWLQGFGEVFRILTSPPTILAKQAAIDEAAKSNAQNGGIMP